MECCILQGFTRLQENICVETAYTRDLLADRSYHAKDLLAAQEPKLQHEHRLVPCKENEVCKCQQRTTESQLEYFALH